MYSKMLISPKPTGCIRLEEERTQENRYRQKVLLAWRSERYRGLPKPSDAICTCSSSRSSTSAGTTWHISLRLTRCDYAGDYYLLPGARSSLLEHDEFFGATWGHSLGEITP